MKIAIAKLVLDFDLYPRTQIDSQHVSSMAEAERAGNEFPPILIDRKSKRVIDGFHRVKKQKLVHGKEATIEATQKTYRSEAEMFLDAVRLNSAHGRGLSPFDRLHAAETAGRLQVDDELLAGALNVTPGRLGDLRTSRSAMGAGGVAVSLKSAIRHMQGRKLNRGQMAANRKLGGNSQQFYVNQVILLLENKLLDTSDKALMARLRRLGEVLDEALAVEK